MQNTAKLLLAGMFAVALTADPMWPRAALFAQAPAAGAQQPQAPSTQPPVFRERADLVSTDVIVRDSRSQFVSDLKVANFELYEDGVKQDIVSFVLVHGGRTFNQLSLPVAAPQEGILVPRRRPTNDSSGRVFIIFVDDLHLDFRSTPKTRELLKKIAKDLIHDGDMFGIVTTGTSSISQQLTYDRQILESAISRITGNSLKLSDIRAAAWSTKGPTEVRHRAHVAFETLNDLLKNLEQVQNRRKAVLYLSSGYDFNPMERTRAEDRAMKLGQNVEDLRLDPFEIEQTTIGAFNEADLIYELNYVTRLANRANATLYPIDPRGLIAGQDVDEEIDYQDWLDHVRETQMGLLTLAEETNGFAIVNQNDFDKGLKRIDSETSDYYLLGYYSNNPDPLKRNRKLEIKIVGRDKLEVDHRQGYLLRNQQRPR